MFSGVATSETAMGRYSIILCPGGVSGYQVILEPGIGQFREFEPRQGHTLIN